MEFDIKAVIAEARAAAANEANKPEFKTVNGIECLVTKQGVITPLLLPEKHLDNPRRKRAKVSLYEALSFMLYLNAHKIPGRTVIFAKATERGGSFTAVIDYHDQERAATLASENKADGESTAPAVPVGTPPKATLANWGEHTVELKLEATPEWARWIDFNGKLLPQETFAEFIEDNMNDIIKPDAADILEMAQLLQGKKTVSFKGGRNLRTGAIALEYVEAIEVNGAHNRQDGAMQLPDKFTLGIVPFVGANGVEIEARLRFRIGTDGKLSFAYILNRPYKLIETAFNVARADIEGETGLKVLLGSGSITAT